MTVDFPRQIIDPARIGEARLGQSHDRQPLAPPLKRTPALRGLLRRPGQAIGQRRLEPLSQRITLAYSGVILILLMLDERFFARGNDLIPISILKGNIIMSSNLV